MLFLCYFLCRSACGQSNGVCRSPDNGIGHSCLRKWKHCRSQRAGFQKL